MQPDDILIEAANFTCQQVGTRECQSLVEKSLKLCGNEIERHLQATDKPGLFAPVFFARDDKEQPGCVLTLEDRAIFAWITGTFRVKNFEAVVPYSTIKQTDADTKSATRGSGGLDVLRVEADDNWTIVFPNICGDGMNLPEILRGVLCGAVTLQHDDSQVGGE